MKITSRIIAVLLASVLLFSLVSCKNDNGSGTANDGEIVMRYGDYTLNEKEFMYIISTFKSQVVTYYQNYMSSYGVSYKESDILGMQMTEEMTIGEYIKDISIEFAQQMLIFEQLCADADITITDQSDIDSIDTALADMEIAYGGTDLFEIELAKLGISKSAIKRYLEANINYSLIREYRYGENGIATVPAENVYEKFINDYYRYDGAMFAYADLSTGEAHTFKFDDDAVKAYFDNDFVKVRHILYKTSDSSNKKLPDDKVAEKKSAAETALSQLQSGEKTFDDLKSQSEDSGFEYVFTYGDMVKPFEEASFEMEVGEFRLVESEYGFHVVEKLEKTDEDFTGKTDENGKTTGGKKDAVIVAMSSKQIRDEALDLFDKMGKGEVDKYPEETDAKKYYAPMKPSYVKKDNSSASEILSIIEKLEVGKFVEKEYPREGTYIIRRLDFTKEDITSDIYSSIEEDLAMTAFSEYVQSFYDKIVVNEALLEKFDVVTIPILDGDLYSI